MKKLTLRLVALEGEADTERLIVERTYEPSEPFAFHVNKFGWPEVIISKEHGTFCSLDINFARGIGTYHLQPAFEVD